jgi:YVTN family beta-propeller protein
VVSPNAGCSSVTSDGTATANELAYFTTACNVEGSTTIVESSGMVGIGTATPVTTLDVRGATTLDGPVRISASGTATATAGANSYAAGFGAVTFDSSISSPVDQLFEWEAEPLGNNTGRPSASMNLLYAQGVAAPANTGFAIARDGVVTFGSGQTFPGTIAGVTAGTGLSGGGTSGNVTLTNSGLLSVGAGTGIVSTGGQTPTLSLNTAYTNSLYVPQTGGAMSGALSLPANGLSVAGNQLVLSGGNVGVGTASPSAPLQVNGNVLISGTGSTLTFPDGSVQSTAAPSSPAGVVAVNPAQVALLKWFPAYQAGATFGVGNEPGALAFDGADIWVANGGSNTVSKLQASTGAVLGTYNVGTSPVGLTFDGANIWAVNGASGNLSKLQASTGAVLGTYSAGKDPYGVAFDGANIWVANYGSNTVTKLQASTGAVVGTYSVGSQPQALAFDGANIWVANYGSNNVTELQAGTGAVLGTYSMGAGSYPAGVAFDGANIWVANSLSNTVTKLQAGTGAVLGIYSVGSGPWAVAFDGANIWVANLCSASVSKL